MNSRVCVFHIAIEISYLSDTSDRPANANHGRMSRLESSYLVGGDISELQHYPTLCPISGKECIEARLCCSPCWVDEADTESMYLATAWTESWTM